MHQIEEKIEQLKNEDFRKLTRPVYAFITFEEDEGHIMALRYEKKGKFLCFGKKAPETLIFNQPLDIKAATEPTNIKWENRHYNASQRTQRLAWGIFLMSVMLAFSGWIVSICERQSIDVANLYPAPSSGCDDIDALYPDNESKY